MSETKVQFLERKASTKLQEVLLKTLPTHLGQVLLDPFKVVHRAIGSRGIAGSVDVVQMVQVATNLTDLAM